MVSLILPYYNGREFIEPTIISIVNQTYEAFELLIVDDGSPSQEDQQCLKDLLNRVNDPRIRLIRKVNTGLSDTRNFAVREAKGDLICFIDQDDVWDPKKLEVQVDIFKQRPTLQVCCTNGVFLEDGKTRPMAIVKKRNFKEGIILDTFAMMLRGNFVICSSVMFRKDIVAKSGGSNRAFVVVPDYDLFVRMARHTDFYFCAQPLVQYRIHATNTVRNKSRMYLETIDTLIAQPMQNWRQKLLASRQFVPAFARVLWYWFARIAA